MVGLIIAVLRLYELVILIRVVLSWVRVNRGHPAVQFIESITEPVLAPFHRVARIGGLDLSPFLVILIIELIISIIR